jgi:hypothetical protein
MAESITIPDFLAKLRKEAGKPVPLWLNRFPDCPFPDRSFRLSKMGRMLERFMAASDELGDDADEGNVMEHFFQAMGENGFERELVVYIVDWLLWRNFANATGQEVLNQINLRDLIAMCSREEEEIYPPGRMNYESFKRKWPHILSTSDTGFIRRGLTQALLDEGKMITYAAHIDHTFDEFVADINQLMVYDGALAVAHHARECVRAVGGQGYDEIPLRPLIEMDFPYDRIETSHVIGAIMIKHSPARRRFLALLILTGGRMEGSLFLPLRVVEDDLLGYLADVIFR